jgi:hypothetical protein
LAYAGTSSHSGTNGRLFLQSGWFAIVSKRSLDAAGPSILVKRRSKGRRSKMYPCWSGWSRERLLLFGSRLRRPTKNIFRGDRIVQQVGMIFPEETNHCWTFDKGGDELALPRIWGKASNSFNASRTPSVRLGWRTQYHIRNALVRFPALVLLLDAYFCTTFFSEKGLLIR